MSRSEMKRIAVQKGEPMPTFERSRRIVIEEPCSECGDERPCQCEQESLDEVRRGDCDGWFHGYWSKEDV